MHAHKRRREALQRTHAHSIMAKLVMNGRKVDRIRMTVASITRRSGSRGDRNA